ncbi:sulfurtransferase complex subunit TusB [Pseudomonas sp. RIT-PI-S]|uniref:sulfurtransferase complex subunit TusB n=1 Tax=Pseudomonas sp. RIT-PI-S TaxID=3035295 RepID=UPI0021DAC345|nr:sulfurtransferase complex subunit TusB [Pseudomonas sp. RIT-PI-S]
MATLHVVSSSPFTDSRLSSCLRTLGPDDGLLLCGEAVQGLRTGSPVAQRLHELSAQLYALSEDCQARGLLDPAVRRVDYPAFVELSLAYDRVNTWL